MAGCKLAYLQCSVQVYSILPHLPWSFFHNWRERKYIVWLFQLIRLSYFPKIGAKLEKKYFTLFITIGDKWYDDDNVDDDDDDVVYDDDDDFCYYY